MSVSGVSLTLQPKYNINLTNDEEQSIEPFVNTLTGKLHKILS